MGKKNVWELTPGEPETVTVTVHRYEQLIKSEEHLRLVMNMYFTRESYRYDDVLSILFGRKGEKKSC